MVKGGTTAKGEGTTVKGAERGGCDLCDGFPKHPSPKAGLDVDATSSQFSKRTLQYRVCTNGCGAPLSGPVFRPSTRPGNSSQSQHCPVAWQHKTWRPEAEKERQRHQTADKKNGTILRMRTRTIGTHRKLPVSNSPHFLPLAGFFRK